MGAALCRLIVFVLVLLAPGWALAFTPPPIEGRVTDPSHRLAPEVESALETKLARALATQEGILAGISAGAAVWSAIELSKRPEHAGQTIVVVVPDSGERYLTTTIYEDPEPTSD